MNNFSKNFLLLVISFVIPTMISYWLLVGFDNYWKGLSEFGIYGFIVRSIIPAILSFIVLKKFVGLERKSWLVVNLTLAMIIWLYLLPIIVMIIFCGIGDNCL